MRCWMAAVITDSVKDPVQASTRGAISSCALATYPDAQPKSYPLRRPFAGGIGVSFGRPNGTTTSTSHIAPRPGRPLTPFRDRATFVTSWSPTALCDIRPTVGRRMARRT